MRRVAIAAALLAFSGTCAGPGSDVAPLTASVRDCSGATFPFPAPDLALSEADSASAQVHLGGLIEVTLHGDAAHRWKPIDLDGEALVPRPDPAAAATVGTQLGEFCAARTGRVVVSSSDGSRTWSVTLDIVR